MAHTTAGGLVALVGTGALALALQVSAHGADATSTRITTPSATRTFIDKGGSPTMHVAGTASAGVTSVDVTCLGGPSTARSSTPVATGVPVAAGKFSVTAPVPHVGGHSPVCRLRALPQGTTPVDDISSYAGPVIDLDRLQRLTQGSATFDFDLTAGSGSGAMEVHSAGDCGIGSMGVVPDDQGDPFAFSGCVANLGPPAVAGSGAPLRVDGQVAQLPFSVLDPDVSSLRLTVHTAKSGRVTWTESAPLVRCASAGSCTGAAETGVRFTRSGTFTANGHQIELRDSFQSTDGSRHTVRTVYGMRWTPPATGALGFAFPGRTGFHGASKGQVVTGFGRRAATVLVRSDRFSDDGDPMVATRALTWSRPPSRIAFSTASASTFGLGYSLKVPKGGAVRLGFTDSDAVRTSPARAMGAAAVAGVMPAPRITSPAKGAVVVGRKTVVKGVVRAGVNGLPVSVKVNGHAAVITATSASRATYKVVFHESGGKHTLTAVARDSGGNSRSTSITVRNK